MTANTADVEALVHSDDPLHPANHICTLCAKFYNLGWVHLPFLYPVHHIFPSIHYFFLFENSPILQLQEKHTANQNTPQVTGTGGGTSIRHSDKIYIAPSGVQKELMKPTDMFVMDFESKEYIRRPEV
jgi:methylthioribulose-1-phosphate dehydratase